MLHLSKYARRVLGFSAFWLLGGCSAIGNARATLEQIFALQEQLQKELPGETIRVTESTSGELSVDLVNSRLASLPADKRAERTRQIATFVRNNYGRANAIRVISIVFKSEADAAGFNVSTSQSTEYAIAELDLVTPSPAIIQTVQGDAATISGAPSAPADTTGRATAVSGIKSISRWNSF